MAKDWFRRKHQSSGGGGAKEANGQEADVGEGVVSFGVEKWKILRDVVQDDYVSGSLKHS